MSVLASLALVCSLLPQSPQGGEQTGAANGKAALLSPAERTALRKLLVTYLDADTRYAIADSEKERETTLRKREEAKEKFEEEWKKHAKKGELLGSMADLRAIFENCFTIKPSTKSVNQVWADKSKQFQLDYSYFLPKAYKPQVPSRTVFLLPGLANEKAVAWSKPAEYFAATWDKSAFAGDTIFHIPFPSEGLELDPVPDFSREGGDAEEQRRIDLMWDTFGGLMQSHNLERNRVYVDAGRGACGFAVRFLTMFPDRFAAAVLRAPVEVDDIRIGGLNGMPLLLLRTDANGAVVDNLKKRVEEAWPNSVTVLNVTDAYPHKGHTAEIEQWLADKKRNVAPPRVVIEPNHDRFNRAYWAKIDVADQLATAAPDKKPRLECIADRVNNRITVKTVGVERFTLLLNDDLVDLDKEFTVVINDKAVPDKRTRNFRDMRERMIGRNDWEWLFPVAYSSAVPK